MPRYVLIATLACMAAACGSDDRGITQPTPQSAVGLVHNTLNPSGNRTSRYLQLSDLQNRPLGFLGFVANMAYDDFTSTVTAAIRTVSWQGGYCGGSPLGLSVPPPVATSRSFQIAFYSDNNGRPSITLYDVTITPADAHERLTFDTGPTTSVCNRDTPNASCYDYSAVLPTPLPITAGTRYWLMVRADMRDTGGTWGWRAGMEYNNHSMVNGPQSSLVRSAIDLAFSLSDR